MTDDRKSALALIVGSALMIITMALHPHGVISPAEVERVARNLTAVHSIGLASVPLIFLGDIGLSQRLRGPDRLALAALVIFGFACAAIMDAAVMDGLVGPNVMRRFVEADTAAKGMWQVALRFGFEINQGYARLYAVLSSVALALWSVNILRSRKLGRGVGIYGCVIAGITLGAVVSGKLRMDVHGFGALVLGQAIWFVAAGMQMWRGMEVDGGAPKNVVNSD